MRPVQLLEFVVIGDRAIMNEVTPWATFALSLTSTKGASSPGIIAAMSLVAEPFVSGGAKGDLTTGTITLLRTVEGTLGSLEECGAGWPRRWP